MRRPRPGALARLRDRPLWLQLVGTVVLLLSLALLASGVAAVTLLRENLVHRIDRELLELRPGARRGFWLEHAGAHGHRRGGHEELNAVYVAYADAGGELVRELRTRKSRPRLPALTAEEVARRGGQPFTVPARDGAGAWRMVLAQVRRDPHGHGASGRRPGGTVAGAAAGRGHATTYDTAHDTAGGPADAGGTADDSDSEDGVAAEAAEPASVVAVALSIRDVDETVSLLTLITAAVGFVVLTAAGSAAYVLVRSSLRPLAEVEETAAAIAGGDLSRRVPPRPPRTEVGRLSLALNAMLGQIERAFRAQRESEEQARGSERRMRQFVADASHELRTPLTSIRGFSELYRQGAVTRPEDVARVMGRVEDEASRMGDLVEELLLLARLDQQRPLERRPVDLLPLAADAVHDLQAVARDRDVRLVVAEAGEPPVVLGDEARLRQVLTNLLTNARVHTPEASPVTVTVGTGGGVATLDVADRGRGLTPEQAERVFERFYRVDTARARASGGSGLGLSIVAAIVAAHGGRVAVRSGPEPGAVFRVELPLAAVPGGGSAADD